MPIATYSDLKTAVADWADRADISTSRMEDFIYMAEADASQVLRVPAMENAELLTVTDGRITIPFDFIELRRLTWDGEHDKVLQYLPWDQFVAINRDDSKTQPLYYSRQGATWYLSAGPSDGDTILCNYYRFIPALSDTLDTNWLLSISPQSYIYGSLKYLYEFTMDNERAAYWSDKFVKELVKLQTIADMAEHRGSALAIRSIE